jgi:cell division protein FtsB
MEEQGKRALIDTLIIIFGSLFVVMAICTYQLQNTAKENASLKLSLQQYKAENTAMKQSMQDQELRNEKLTNTIKENEELYKNLDGIKQENDTLKTANADLTGQKQGLIEYIQKKTGLKVRNIVKAKFEVTAYTNAEGAWDVGDPNWGHTFSGKLASRGTAAAPKTIPIFSEVIFNDIDVCIDITI